MQEMAHLLDVLSNPLAVLVVLLVVVAFFYCVGMYNYWVFNGMNIPGAKPLPYIGNLRDMTKYGGIHRCMLEYMKKYGKVFSLCTGRKASIVIADPEILKQIMVKDFHIFTNRFSSFNLAPDKRKKGLLQLNDGDWRRVRSVLTPTFTSGKLKLMVPLIEKSCDTLVEKVKDIADTGKSVDMFSWFSLMSLEVILATAFGIESPVQKDSAENKFLKKVRELFKSPVIMRVFLMIPFNNFIVQLVAKMGGQMDFFRQVAREIIETKKIHGPQRTKDMVDLMLSAKNADGTTKLHEEEMISQSVTFLVAGHETASNTLAMSAYYLALNPDVQERLKNEILMAQQISPDKPLYELVNELEYLECVINEVLRLHPPVHYVNRTPSEPYSINAMTTIPAGMEVVIPMYTLHRDPEAWPDPEKFDPERFRGPAKESRHPFQFLPFGEGPRNCIGKRLALLEVKITLVNIIRKYKFRRCPETQVPMEFFAGVTLMPKHGIFLRIETSD